MAFTVLINGKETQIAPETNVRTLLQVLGSDNNDITVTVNRLRIDKSDWAHARLRHGDRVIILELISN